MKDKQINQKKLFCGVLIYILSFGLTMLFGKTFHVNFYLGKLQITSDIICGIINVGYIIACLMIIHAEPKNGLYASIVLIVLSVIPPFQTIFINQNYAVLPGIITDISALPGSTA